MTKILIQWISPKHMHMHIGPRSFWSRLVYGSGSKTIAELIKLEWGLRPNANLICGSVSFLVFLYLYIYIYCVKCILIYNFIFLYLTLLNYRWLETVPKISILRRHISCAIVGSELLLIIVKCWFNTMFWVWSGIKLWGLLWSISF